MIDCRLQSAFLMMLLVATGCTENETSLHLLVLVPPGEADSLLPAAELAVDKLNARDDLLPGYKLKLIKADSDMCTEISVTESYISFIKYIESDEQINLVGVTGLTCTDVTRAISPLAGHPDIDLLQISAGAAPPIFTNEQDYPRLYRVISSSATHNDAVLELASEFQWETVTLISDLTHIDHVGTAVDFVAKISDRTDFNLTSHEFVTSKSTKSVINTKVLNAQVVYLSVTKEEAQHLLCAGYTNGYLYPGYKWIFHNLRVEDFKDFMCGSDPTAMMKALENVLLINYKLEPTSTNEILVSGDTYEEYQRQLGSNVSIHANALHDSVWALTLALNNSLENLTLDGLQNYGPGKSAITSVIECNLQTVNFSGALGHIQFTDRREAETMVEIIQVINGTAVAIGYYSPRSKLLNFLSHPETLRSIRTRDGLPTAFPIVTFILAGMVVYANTVTLLLYIYNWNKPTIKATSPRLGILILIGCYFLSAGPLILGIREYVDAFGPLCQAEFWFQALGYQLIYGTLLFRLLRIYRIFVHTFSLPGRFWFDWPLLAMILLTFLGIALLHVLWTAVAPLETVNFSRRTTYILFCDSPNTYYVWYTINITYIWVTVMFVAIFAYLTRKVTIRNFQDTKQVNLFVLVSFVALTWCFAYSSTFSLRYDIKLAYTFEVLPYIITPAASIGIMFAPKLWNASFQKRVYLAHKLVAKTKYSLPSQPSKITIL